MANVVIDDSSIHYEVYGNAGPWLVFVSGLGGHGAFWKEQIEYFSDKFRVVIHDHRGHGKSTGGDKNAGVVQASQDLLRIVDAIGADQIILAGHSMGGMIAQQFALDNPLRVRALLISGSMARADDFTKLIFGFRRRVIEALGPEDFCRLQTILTSGKLAESLPIASILEAEQRSLQSQTKPEVLGARLKSIELFDRSADLEHINVPTLVISSEDDEQAPPRAGRLIASRIPGAKFELLQGGGHFFPKTLAPIYNELAGKFIADRVICRPSTSQRPAEKE